jgi:hypothetical protein
MHADGEIVHGNDFSINDHLSGRTYAVFKSENPKIKLFILGTGLLD